MKTPRFSTLVLGLSLLSGALGCGGEDAPEPGNQPPETTSQTTGATGQAARSDAGSEADSGVEPGAGDVGGADSPEPADRALLAEAQTDEQFGYSFRAPISFQRAADDFVAQARQALQASAGAGGPYFTVPRMVFAVPGTDARIFVGEFPKGAGVADPTGWDQGYVVAAEAKAGAADFAHSRIRVAGQDALFFRIEAAAFRNDRVVFKARGGERIQIDFLLPTASVGEMEALVSASIASIEIS